MVDLKLMGNFLHSPFNKWIFISSWVFLACIFVFELSIPRVTIFPRAKDFAFGFYNDSANGGHSEILSQTISDSAIHLDFNLREGFLSPYVGITITHKNNRLINLVHYNQFHINVAGNGIENIGVYLFTKNPSDKSRLVNNELCFFNNLELDAHRKLYILDLGQLKIPDWCRDVNHIAPNEKIEPDLKHIQNINIATAYNPIYGTKCSLSIYSISFERNNKQLNILLWMAEFMLILILIGFHYIRAYRIKSTVSVTIAYKPVDVETETPPINDFLEHINHNFHTDLTLEQVSDNTGINQRRIANLIQETFGCNFKTYVNQLRINESKRLLSETDLQIGEIAFKVGFNNQTHFNRVFKSLVGTSPSEFRDKK